jgi:hypothetical protein
MSTEPYGMSAEPYRGSPQRVPPPAPHVLTRRLRWRVLLGSRDALIAWPALAVFTAFGCAFLRGGDVSFAPFVPALVVVAALLVIHVGNRRILWLLERGLYADARLVRKKESRFGRPPRVAMSFDFVDARGQGRRIVITTTEPDNYVETATQRVAYDPGEPRRAVLLAHVLCGPRDRPDGTVVDNGSWVGTAFQLGIPAIAFVVATGSVLRALWPL